MTQLTYLSSVNEKLSFLRSRTRLTARSKDGDHCQQIRIPAVIMFEVARRGRYLNRNSAIIHESVESNTRACRKSTVKTTLPPYRSSWLVPVAWTSQPAVYILRQEEALDADERCHLGSSWRGAETLSVEEPVVVSDTSRQTTHRGS